MDCPRPFEPTPVALVSLLTSLSSADDNEPVMMSDEVQGILKLLARGETGEAREAAARTTAALKRKRSQIDQDLEFLSTLLPMFEKTQVDQRMLPLGETVGRAERRQRRLAVLQAAEALAQSQSLVTTDDVDKMLVEQGFQSRPNKTAIGLYLQYADGWKRVDQGVYAKEGDDA